MAIRLTRRHFLKLAALTGFAAVGFRPFGNQEEFTDAENIGRVTVRSISVYKQPREESQILFQHYRDELLNIYYEYESPYGPEYNPIWYRVFGGWVHRSDVFRTPISYNTPGDPTPETGQIAEVTVPYTQALRYTSSDGWTPLYRLYSTSVHWVKALEEGPDGQPWYRLLDELLKIEYHVPAAHLRLIQPEELTPITPEKSDTKRIEVNITLQKMMCFEGDEKVMETRVSTGVPYRPTDLIPWETPKGSFNIYSKMPSKHMGDGRLTGNPEDYELPGVPWTSFFESTGVAFHGTYWHDDYGRQRSHGCVNMRSSEARWLFRWITPISDPTVMEKTGYGTRVLVYGKESMNWMNT